MKVLLVTLVLLCWAFVPVGITLAIVYHNPLYMTISVVSCLIGWIICGVGVHYTIFGMEYRCDHPSCKKQVTVEDLQSLLKLGWRDCGNDKHLCKEHGLFDEFGDEIREDGGKLWFRRDIIPERTSKENWSEYCSISEDLQRCGWRIKEVQIEHDCISGELEPYCGE